MKLLVLVVVVVPLSPLFPQPAIVSGKEREVFCLPQPRWIQQHNSSSSSNNNCRNGSLRLRKWNALPLVAVVVVAVIIVIRRKWIHCHH
uniref:Putative secreted peptide n=1 Tax=Anopheles braziliensis TaxID=58242 RepID=A0A2M3ZP31_9DIPT